MRLPLFHRPEELNRILLLARELEASSTPISADAIQALARSNALHAERPSYRENIQVAVLFGLLTGGNSGYKITALGNAFIALNPDSHYELAPGQARFFVRKLHITGSI